MSDFLLGKEVSGTPLETRGGVIDYSNFLRSAMRGQAGQQVGQITAPFQQLTTDALMALLSVPQIAEMLINPADSTKGLFSSLEPFERRQTAEQTAGVRSIFGSQGGRFGRNVAEAETRLRSELGGEFLRTREQALLEANSQRMNFLSSLFQPAVASAQLATTPFDLFSRTFQAGPPTFVEGALPGLIAAGANLYTAQSLFGGGAGAGRTAAGTGGARGSNLFRRQLAPMVSRGVGVSVY